jgi:hypothetical protein
MGQQVGRGDAQALPGLSFRHLAEFRYSDRKPRVAEVQREGVRRLEGKARSLGKAHRGSEPVERCRRVPEAMKKEEHVLGESVRAVHATLRGGRPHLCSTTAAGTRRRRPAQISTWNIIRHRWLTLTS